MFVLKRCSSKGAFEAIPKKNLNLDFDKINKKFKVMVFTPVVVLIKIRGCDMSCFKNGKLLIKNCKDKENAEKVAKDFYSRYK